MVAEECLFITRPQLESAVTAFSITRLRQLALVAGFTCWGTGNLTSLINNTVSGNTAWAGGGIFIGGAVTGADIVQNLIVNNSASAGGGGIAWKSEGQRHSHTIGGLTDRFKSSDDAERFVVNLAKAWIDANP